METPKDKKEDKYYRFGNEVLGPFLATIVLLFAFALPIWIFWNHTICMHIFPSLNQIEYLDSFCLCVLIWCIGRVWKGVPNGKK